jgi:hypothetical protein
MSAGSAGDGSGGAGADGRREVGGRGGLEGKSEEVACGFPEAWLGAEGAAVAVDGVSAVAEGFEDYAEVVPGGSIGGVEVEGPAETGDGVLDAAGLEQFESGQVPVIRGRGVGVERERHRAIL